MSKKTIEEVQAQADSIVDNPEMPTLRGNRHLPATATREEIVTVLRWIEEVDGHRMSGTARLAIQSIIRKLDH